jgi:hypothetical protein
MGIAAQVTIPSDVAEKMHGRGLRDLLTGRPMTIADGKIAVTGEAVRILKLQ